MLSPRLVLFCLGAWRVAGAEPDSDRDGLPDRFEQALLQRFAPTFHISASDCDVAPAEFVEGAAQPEAKSRNGTVYGQVFAVGNGRIEIHYYHLWAADCGLNGHALDSESVSGLLRADGDEARAESWRAELWYAAAHENTLCDMSNGARAAALGALDRGPDVWVSRNKHASFLSRALCAGGCGGDRCDDSQPLRIARLINLGEAGAPMSGAEWSASGAWPLAAKMKPRYTPELLARMPAGDGIEAVPARDLAQGTHATIKVAGRTYESMRSASAGADASTKTSARRAGRALAAAGRAVRSFALRLNPQP